MPGTLFAKVRIHTRFVFSRMPPLTLPGLAATANRPVKIVYCSFSTHYIQRPIEALKIERKSSDSRYPTRTKRETTTSVPRYY